MSNDDNDHRRYIFRWHPLPQPAWAGSEAEARLNAIRQMWEESDMSYKEAATFVDAHGEVVEVVE